MKMSRVREVSMIYNLNGANGPLNSVEMFRNLMNIILEDGAPSHAEIVVNNKDSSVKVSWLETVGESSE